MHHGSTPGLHALRAKRPYVPTCAPRFLDEFLLPDDAKEKKI
jgi:hypothetical protein